MFVLYSTLTNFFRSIDNFIYVWDTNDPRTPAVTLSAVTGASQVKKNPVFSPLFVF